MPTILMSYRRADTDMITARIRDRLATRYGDDSVLMDVDSIPLGVDFREFVTNAARTSDIVIAVIGPEWAGRRRHGRGLRSLRIHEETDPIRLEIGTALKNKIPIIPILVGGAKMPRPQDLPRDMRGLSFLNAATLDGGIDFHAHMDRIERSIRVRLASGAEAPVPTAALSDAASMTAASFFTLPRTLHVPKRILVVALGAVAALVLAYLASARAVKDAILILIVSLCAVFVGWMLTTAYWIERPPRLKIGLYAAAFVLCYEIWLLLAQLHIF
jgi:hypothetical protein